MPPVITAKNTPASVRAELAKDLSRTKLQGKSGRKLWRSLDELSRDEGFGDMLQSQYPRFFAEWDPMHRRDFLRLMGASLALGGLTACTRQPNEKIIPYVKQPENLIPGKPMYYATAMPLQGYGVGLLATSHMGRPTKLDGNEKHPASLGGSDAITQAAILNLYDPDRIKDVVYQGREGEKSWDDFFADMKSVLEAQAAVQGQGIRILTGTITSPTILSLIKEFLNKFPAAVWHQYEPINRDYVYEATTMAFGQPLDPVCQIGNADVILSLDSDFLSFGPGRLRYARDFASRRSAMSGLMNRLYTVESQMSLTGAAADHRVAATPDEVEKFARAVASHLGLKVNGSNETKYPELAKVVADDLRKAGPSSLVIAGEQRSPALQALAFAINASLGSIGKTMQFVKPAVSKVDSQAASIADLATAISGGSVETLVMFDSNPVYNAPAELGFGKLLEQVKLVVSHGLLPDETAARSHYSLPGTHFLESWGDVIAYDGTASIIQPLIEPLYKGKSVPEVLATLLGRNVAGYELVRETWATMVSRDAAWNESLHDGLIKDSASAPVSVSLVWSDKGLGEAQAISGNLDVSFAQDYAVLDGSFANNGWMQEMPRPITTLTWDNALLVNQSTAANLGLSTGDFVELAASGGLVKLPVLIAVGIPDSAGVISIGYGRTAGGRIAQQVGFDANPIRSAASPWRSSVKVSRVSGVHDFALTQEHHSLEGRNHVRVGTIEQFNADNKFVSNMDEFGYKYGRNENTPSAYPQHDYSKGPQWGMVIDLSACIGCNACMIACQAENNIPVVGKDQVSRGREMHWIRVDRYYEGMASSAAVHHQPMTCVHCENAPCEAVCPVAATVHSTEGLNQMVYNRCVGTRYCSNNCPYKVRRFNFYKFADHETPSLKLQRNPNVTVRARGVMEKCTFCVQRISDARITARKANRPIADGEVITACQQACPTGAITFGDILDPLSKVAQKKSSPLDYGVLAVLSTRPRLTYHARIRNPNPSIQEEPAMESHGHG